jgi:hypothetical protein
MADRYAVQFVMKTRDGRFETGRANNDRKENA